MNAPVRTFLVLLGCAFLLLTLTRLANHELARWSLTLSLGGAFIAFPALFISLRPALLLAFTLGLLWDAAHPVPFGFHAFLLATATTLIHAVRHRFPRNEPVVATLVVLFANLFLLIVSTSLLTLFTPDHPSVWSRFLTNLLLSQIVLAFITPWFFALQHHSLHLLRADFAHSPLPGR